MPFPTGWPPPRPSGIRSGRFYAAGTGTAAFDDNAFLFGAPLTAMNTLPTPYVAPGSSAPTDFGRLPVGGGRDPRDSRASAELVTGTTQAYSWLANLRICNDGGGVLEFSFDGVNVHGVVMPGDEPPVYAGRYEAGIAVRGVGAVFRIEAW